MHHATTEAIQCVAHGQSATQTVPYSLRYDDKRSQITPTQNLGRGARRRRGLARRRRASTGLDQSHEDDANRRLPSRNLYDLCSWSSHIPLQKPAILLGTSPPKLFRKYDKAWTHSTSTTCTQLIYSPNLTFSNTNPQPLPGSYRPSPPPLPAPSLMIHSVRCVKVPLTGEKCFFVTYVTPVGIWTASSPPSPSSLLGYGNVPCVPLLPPHPRAYCDTSAPPLPSLTLTLTKHHRGQKGKNKPIPCQYKIKKIPSCDEFQFHTHMAAYKDGSGFKTQFQYRESPWGGLGTSTQTVFSFGVFSWIFLNGGCVLVTGPPPPLEWLSFPPLVAAVLITPKGAESPGSDRIGVIGAFFFSPSEAVLDKLHSPWLAQERTKTLRRSRIL